MVRAMTATHALHTDLYQLTMLAAYFHHGEADRKATCELFVRRLPKNRRFLVVAGLERALRYLQELRFTDEQIDVLTQIPSLKKAMSPGFVEYLRGFRFRGDVWAMPEGTIAFENEPLLRVEADLGEAQLVETFLLSCVNHQTMIASKAARVILALKGRSVLEFGTRRTHYEAAVDVARSAWIAGFEATSNVAAFEAFGVPARGTMAHMFIMAAESERSAFIKYSKIFPRSSYLVDTYNTIEGVGLALDTIGDDVSSVRLDSGDLATLTKQTRALLKERKREDVKIVVSSDLDEYEIERLIAEGDFDVAGVGTRLATSDDAPSLGGVYKLTQIDGRPVAKFAEGKITYPGSHQVFRHQSAGKAHFDSLGLTKELSYEFLGTTALLVEAMTGGRPTAAFDWGGDETLATMRALCRDGIENLPDRLKVIGPRSDVHEKHYEVRPSAAVLKLLDEVKSARTH